MMKIKQIMPIKKRTRPHCQTAYFTVGIKAVYISNDAMRMLGETEYIRMSIDLENRKIIISKAEHERDDTFKLSSVDGTAFAKRIETNRAILSIIKEGFPLYMVDVRLPVELGLDGSIMADFSYNVPIKEAQNV